MSSSKSRQENQVSWSTLHSGRLSFSSGTTTTHGKFIAFPLIRRLTSCLCAFTTVTGIPVGTWYQIFRREQMPAIAVGLDGVLGTHPFTSQGVNANGNKFHMNGVTTFDIATQVVDNQMTRGNFHEQFIEKAMSTIILTLTSFVRICGFAVAVLIGQTLPFPTRDTSINMDSRYNNLEKKASKKFSVERKSVRLGVGHIGSYLANLIRLTKQTQSVFWAISIMPQEVV